MPQEVVTAPTAPAAGLNQLEFKGPTSLSAGQSVTFNVEYAPDFWVIWADPGAAGSGIALIYQDGNGSPSGYGIALAPGGRVRLPSGNRTVTIYGSTGTIVVSACACSGRGRDFDVLPQSS